MKRNVAALALVVGAVMGSLASVGCSRNNIEAVNLSLEGDKAKNSNVDEAVSKYEQAVALDPTNHRILWKLSEAYRKKEQWDKVATTAVKAEKLAPTFANYYFQHGLAMARQAVKGPTSWADAKQPLEEAIQKDANLPDAHFELAEVLLHMDDEAGALKEYTAAIKVKPDQLIFYSVLADLYQRLGFVNQAEQVLKEGVNFGKEGDKMLFNLHTLLGVSADLKGHVDEALKEYELAKKACGPCNEAGQQIAFFNYGVALSQAKRGNEATGQLQSFYKMVCKGGAKERYSNECAQAQEVARKNGGTLQ